MSYTVADKPSMDEGGLEYFKAAVGASQCYLEYGCGGSTVYAAKTAKVPTIIAIDTDARWVENVRAAIAGGPSRTHIEHCDLGEVGDWGTPKDTAKFRDFWKYMSQPWSVAKSQHRIPDTVLVDGRFRIASFLYTLVSARIGTRVLFDDYFDRPHYFVVEQFCDLLERHGRMAVFSVNRSYTVPDIAAAIARYSVDWG